MVIAHATTVSYILGRLNDWVSGVIRYGSLASAICIHFLQLGMKLQVQPELYVPSQSHGGKRSARFSLSESQLFITLLSFWSLNYISSLNLHEKGCMRRVVKFCQAHINVGHGHSARQSTWRLCRTKESVQQWKLRWKGAIEAVDWNTWVNPIPLHLSLPNVSNQHYGSSKRKSSTYSRPSV